MRSSTKKLTLTIATISAVVTLGGVALIAFSHYSNWSAERKARAFCEAIPIGSAISSASARAENEKVRWGSENRYYRFFFPGAFLDKGVCDVDVDEHGVVVRKASSMVYD